MNDADVAEILKLAAEPSSVPLGDAHRQLLDERLADHEKNSDDVASRDQGLWPQPRRPAR